MRNISVNSLDNINKKLDQLSSVIDLLMRASNNPQGSEFANDTLNNSAWLMADLVDQIKQQIQTKKAEIE